MMYERPQEKSYKAAITAILERQSEQKLVYDLKSSVMMLFCFSETDLRHIQKSRPHSKQRTDKNIEEEWVSCVVI